MFDVFSLKDKMCVCVCVCICVSVVVVHIDGMEAFSSFLNKFKKIFGLGTVTLFFFSFKKSLSYVGS